MIEYLTLLCDRRPPRQLVLQLTDRCNAHCPQCGMNVDSTMPRTTMQLPYALAAVEHVARNHFQALSITGGEPLLYLDAVCAIVARARELGIAHVRTGTNGFLFSRPDDPSFDYNVSQVARSLTDAGVTTFWISIDSAVGTVHERIRGLPGVWRGIRRALPIFHSYGLFPAANVGLTRLVGGAALEAADAETFALHARQALQDVFATVIDLGFTMCGLCYPMSLPEEESGSQAAYRATSTAHLVDFTTREKAILYDELLRLLPDVRRAVRLFTPRSSLAMLRDENLARGATDKPRCTQDGVSPRAPGGSSAARRAQAGGAACYPCLGGVHFFFLAASGQLYPCGYRGEEPLGAPWDVDFDVPRKATCVSCEWECFRDPSQLAGPLGALRREPWTLLHPRRGDRERLRLWHEDVRYVLACDLFNGHTPPDYRRLAGGRGRRVRRLETDSSAAADGTGVVVEVSRGEPGRPFF